MGQKVNPYGFRLGITTDHVSRWFSDSRKPGQRYSDFVAEDVKIRQLLLKTLDRAGVDASEVEDVIAMMPGVLEVAAVGVPDEKSGEVVKVVIVKKDPNLTAEMVKEHARANLTGYKHPRIVEFRKELPKTNVGKILRRELRDTPAQ